MIFLARVPVMVNYFPRAMAELVSAIHALVPEAPVRET
jgi:hypothetical protein